jgi:hypothetical protein
MAYRFAIKWIHDSWSCFSYKKVPCYFNTILLLVLKPQNQKKNLVTYWRGLASVMSMDDELRIGGKEVRWMNSTVYQTNKAIWQ